jgi:hypothetical protein
VMKVEAEGNLVGGGEQKLSAGPKIDMCVG